MLSVCPTGGQGLDECWLCSGRLGAPQNKARQDLQGDEVTVADADGSEVKEGNGRVVRVFGGGLRIALQVNTPIRCNE